MIAHTHLHVSDLTAAKAFYSRVLAPLGYTIAMEIDDAVGFCDGRNTDLWIVPDPVVPTHLAFQAKTRDEVGAFYREALAAGARDNGPPGYREHYGPGYYAAFVHDPDGHNIEAVWFDQAKANTAAGM